MQCTYQHVLKFECDTNSLERRVLINSCSYNAMETGVMNILIPVRKMPCRPFMLTGDISKQKIFFSLPSSSYLICHKPETSLTRVHCHRTASQTLYVQIVKPWSQSWSQQAPKSNKSRIKRKKEGLTWWRARARTLGSTTSSRRRL